MPLLVLQRLRFCNIICRYIHSVSTTEFLMSNRETFVNRHIPKDRIAKQNLYQKKIKKKKKSNEINLWFK